MIFFLYNLYAVSFSINKINISVGKSKKVLFFFLPEICFFKYSFINYTGTYLKLEITLVQVIMNQAYKTKRLFHRLRLILVHGSEFESNLKNTPLKNYKF